MMGKPKVLLICLPSARGHSVAEAFVNGGAELYSCCPTRHPGLLKLSEEMCLCEITDVKAIRNFALKIKPDLAYVDPEVALATGVVDALLALGIPCVGPTQENAEIETSKGFARNLLGEYGIQGNPEYRIFTSMDGVREYLLKLGEFVVKPDGLTGGKGVKVFGDDLFTIDEGVAYCNEVLKIHPSFLIEEKLKGQEFSVQAFVSEDGIVFAPIAQDFKRAYLGDTGPNTGSMGSYSCADHSLPFLAQEDVETAKTIIVKSIEALQKKTGKTYRGIIYGAFIKTTKGIELIEFNARGGDPEFINTLVALQGNFLDLCFAIANGTLADCKISFAEQYVVCKYVVPQGYPNNPKPGPIYMSGVKSCDGLHIYYGDVAQQEDGSLFMRGSRAVLLVGVGDTMEKAGNIAELATMQVRGSGCFHRSDIGTSVLIQKSVDNMRKILGK